MKSIGAAEFAERFPGKVAELGQRFEVEPGTVSAWRSGAKMPSREKREAIYAAGGPLPERWLQPIIPVGGPVEPAALPIIPGGATPDAVVSVADEHLVYCRRLQAQLMAEESAMPVKDRIASAEKLSGMILDLGKLTGAGIINQRQIVDSPYFALLMADILAALTPWPEALRAVSAVCASKKGV